MRTASVYNLGVCRLKHSPLLGEIDCALWYGDKGSSIKHRILIDGTLISGEQNVDDFYEDYLPDRDFYWYFLNKGVLSGIVFTTAMFFMGQAVSILSVIFLFFFFSFSMGLAHFGLWKLRTKNNA